MGCTASKPTSDAERVNHAIDQQIKADRMRMRKEVKILLLGAGESGKSTVLKQMRLIHQGSYQVDERRNYKEIIYSNALQSIHVILDAMEELGIAFSDPSNTENALLVLNVPPTIEEPVLDAPLVEAISALWEDSGLQACVTRSREYQLNDSAAYYLSDIKRIGQPDYEPSDQDILRSRTKTTGISETKFPVGDLVYRMFDVGGQRSERKKWLSLFSEVNALLFLVALSEYDQQLYEDETVNRMQESLMLWESICNSKWFKDSAIILFLNKIDLFREKLESSPLVKYFSNYKGSSFDEACDFFALSFQKCNRTPSKKIYTHFTCATDTNMVRIVMASVTDTIINMNLRDSGLL